MNGSSSRRQKGRIAIPVVLEKSPIGSSSDIYIRLERIQLKKQPPLPYHARHSIKNPRP